MPRHSKNNTASSVFTYHESNSLEYGTKRQRLGRDSFREYDACFLCLQTARDPVACPQGHLACKECIYESILTQKQTIKREERILEQKQQDIQNQKARDEEEAKQTILDEFEKTQTSMLGTRKKQTSESTPVVISTSEKNEFESSDPTSNTSRELATTGSKRKFELVEEDLKDIADRDVEKACQRLAGEKAEAAKTQIGSFWVPSMTPDASKLYTTTLKPVQKQAMCTATKHPHPVSLKSLIPIKFQKEEGNKDKHVCPACLKSLCNSTKLSAMRNCGHVICNTCIEMFVKKTKKCYVCETKTKPKDIVDMSPEGTGFASGSTAAVAEKWSVAFQ
ncbi:hypothetical protein J3Q64DRAFT_1267478 [Phycomyces blakesleeanus]|uniref:RING-type domain-containing protein n=1 Tax=Phycomyces blakesleeanus TaxID=4837 RepID=A0ABR3ASF1_PHYBL